MLKRFCIIVLLPVCCLTVSLPFNACKNGNKPGTPNQIGIGVTKFDFDQNGSYYQKVTFFTDSTAKKVVYTLVGYDGADSLKINPFQDAGPGSSPIIYLRC